jgi:hypothetical protein
MVGAQSASTAAHVLRRAGLTDVATALDRHGQLLTAAAGARCHAASVRPPDPLPMVQAQELSLALAALRRGGTILPIDGAWRIAAALPDLTTALRDAAGHEVRRRRWLVPSRTTIPDAPAWVPVTAASAPALTRQLSAAAAHAPTVGAAVAGAAPASAGVAASASPTAVARHSAPTATRPSVRRAGRAR